jgi:hypothetical protein
MNDSPNPFSAGQNLPTTVRPAEIAVAEQRAIAEVQAAYVIAKKYPRDPVAAVDRILQNCTRPTLADDAVYEYARGGTKITGPSIRLAEELARGWGNVSCGVIEMARHAGYSECLAYAVDLETNFRDEKRFTVKHWRDTQQGGYAVKDERDIYEIVANQGARRKRACILAVIPGDVQEAALRQCDVTLRTKADVTPEKLASLVDKFGELGVPREAIEKRIQRRLDAMTPALMVQLGRIYTSLKDGMSEPGDWFELEPAQQQQQPEAKTGNAGAKGALRRKQAPKPPEKPQEQPAAPEAQAPSQQPPAQPAQPEPAGEAQKSVPF